MMNKEQKKQYINDMTTQFDKTEEVIVNHYQGLTVTQLDDLRKKKSENGIKIKNTKNRNTKIAMKKKKHKEQTDISTGEKAEDV